MTKHTIDRSYLIRRVERYEVELPDDTDPQELIDHHFNSFDTEVATGGALQDISDTSVEYAELKLTIIDREAGKVLPFKRRERHET